MARPYIQFVGNERLVLHNSVRGHLSFTADMTACFVVEWEKGDDDTGQVVIDTSAFNYCFLQNCL